LLKAALADALNNLLAPIREEYLASEAWQQSAEAGYPPEKKAEVKKKVKKEVDPEKKAAAMAARQAAQAQNASSSGVQEGVEKLNVEDKA
jgi:tyrosyl-tRNA synthetase